MTKIKNNNSSINLKHNNDLINGNISLKQSWSVENLIKNDEVKN